MRERKKVMSWMNFWFLLIVEKKRTILQTQAGVKNSDICVIHMIIFSHSPLSHLMISNPDTDDDDNTFTLTGPFTTMNKTDVREHAVLMSLSLL
jgi:hypothetical protein